MNQQDDLIGPWSAVPGMGCLNRYQWQAFKPMPAGLIAIQPVKGQALSGEE